MSAPCSVGTDHTHILYEVLPSPCTITSFASLHWLAGITVGAPRFSGFDGNICQVISVCWLEKLWLGFLAMKRGKPISHQPTTSHPPPGTRWLMTMLAQSVLGMKTWAMALLGTWLQFQPRWEDGFIALLWCVLCRSAFSKQKFNHANIYRNWIKKIKTSESCCSELLITNPQSVYE